MDPVDNTARAITTAVDNGNDYIRGIDKSVPIVFLGAFLHP